MPGQKKEREHSTNHHLVPSEGGGAVKVLFRVNQRVGRSLESYELSPPLSTASTRSISCSVSIPSSFSSCLLSSSNFTCRRLESQKRNCHCHGREAKQRGPHFSLPFWNHGTAPLESGSGSRRQWAATSRTSISGRVDGNTTADCPQQQLESTGNSGLLSESQHQVHHKSPPESPASGHILATT